MLTLLTATGCRPKAWALCERLMLAQDYHGAVRWLIVDDGQEAQPITFDRAGWTLEVIRPSPRWSQGMNSQSRNLRAGLAHICDGERVALIEDDDHYSQGWLSAVESAFELAELIGESRARYYNIALRKGRQLCNKEHASLCSTAVRGKALKLFREVCAERHDFIDMQLWKRFDGSTALFTGNRVTGIKGLPGRSGIGMGHKDTFRGEDDPNGALLRSWIGSDAELYL
jgi:hypothetical protein